MTSAFNWRAIFWFLSITSGLSVISFVLFFCETFRRERSLTYQNVLKQRRKAAVPSSLKEKIHAGNDESAAGVKKKNTSEGGTTEPRKEAALDFNLSLIDVNPLKPLGQILRRKNNVIVLISSGEESFFYFRPEWHSKFLCAGFQFSFNLMISYSTSRTLSTSYGYSPLKIGFVTLAFGIGKSLLFQDFARRLITVTLGDSGGIAGSVWGGRWSDYELTRLKTVNGGIIYPEVCRCGFCGHGLSSS